MPKTADEQWLAAYKAKLMPRDAAIRRLDRTKVEIDKQARALKRMLRPDGVVFVVLDDVIANPPAPAGSRQRVRDGQFISSARRSI